jgi:hypothetical protein
VKILRDALLILVACWLLVCATIVNVDARIPTSPHRAGWRPMATPTPCVPPPCPSDWCLPGCETFSPYTPRGR